MIAKDAKWTMNKTKEETRQNRTPDLRESGADFGLTVSYRYSRIVLWGSTLWCDGLPE